MQQRLSLVILLSFFISSLLVGCASYQSQQDKTLQETSLHSEKPIHTFYIASGLGDQTSTATPPVLRLLKQELATAPKNSTMLFTGNYISAEVNARSRNEQLLEEQLELITNFKGKTFFVPGENEWESKNTTEIEWVENYLKKRDIKGVKVTPNNVCPLEYRKVSENLDLIFIDSKWYISNWDRIEGINQKCTDIKSKRRFIEELEGMIKDARKKNLIIVMHHPIFSNGMYANNYMGGMNPKKVFFQRYQELVVKVSALVQELDRVTIVSGHEQSLQYLLSKDKVHQIISGSLGDTAKTLRKENVITAAGGQLAYKGMYTHGAAGFVKLSYYEDGRSQATFITDQDNITFDLTKSFPETFTYDSRPNFTQDSVLVPVVQEREKLIKSGFFRFIYGDRYRNYYGIPVTASNTDLSVYRGGLNVKEAGGGHQTFSAKLKDSTGAEYGIRGLEKDAFKFLKFKVKGITFEEEEYKGTLAEEVVYDFFTTSHPFMQLVIDPLASEIGVNHAAIELHYLPKQPNLAPLGSKYGDALYWFEQRPNDGHENFPGYNRANPDVEGKIVTFESTTDVLEKIKEDEKYSVDQKAWVRARLFDMLIGDWDRHQDQWRFAEYEVDKNNTRFLPIPRDRDAAFAKFDGVMITLLKMFLPDTRFWQTYKGDINNVKWYNGEGNNLDRAFLAKVGTETWLEQARYIQNQLTKTAIDEAFNQVPLEVQDATLENLKASFIARLEKLDKIAQEYGSYLNKVVAVHATHKDDKIEVIRLPKGRTQILIKRALKDEVDPIIYDRIFDKRDTKEVWIYGLNDDDEFTVTGEGKQLIQIRIIGGFGEDVYEIENKKKLKIYDWKYESSVFTDKIPARQLTNLYETNTYHWRYFKENNNILLPNVGFQTDDGLFVGAKNTYTNYGFNGNPYRFQHFIFANYYFNFSAIEMAYAGVFANVMPKWNLEVGGYFTSDSFANNFFGFGNGTTYDDDAVNRDFNRARMGQLRADIGIAYKTLRFKGLFERIEVQESSDRLFNPSTAAVSDLVFDGQTYAGAEASVRYRNQNAMDFPSKARHMEAAVGFKKNVSNADLYFGYASLKIGFEEGLNPSGSLVLGSSAAVMTNFGGGNYLFYHAPSIGGNTGLRGYRNERFTGNTTFYQTTDLKLRLAQLRTSVVPITLGTYGGFDYGRVWSEFDTSETLHTSYGGGLWLSGLNSLAFKAGFFVSEEDQMVQVGFLLTN